MLDPWFQKAPERRFKAFRNLAYWLLIERRVVKEADAVLFTSQEEKELAKSSFPFYSANGVVVGYGVPKSPYSVTECHVGDSSEPYFLFLSRIHPKKGVDILLKAYAEIYSQILEIPKLLIAGNDEGTYALEMKRLTKSLGLEAKVCWLGQIQGEKKWSAILNSEAFILPSHQENFGIAVAEALAAGIPVLTTNKVNIWKEIEMSGGGIISNDDLSGVVQSIKKFLQLSASDRALLRERASVCYEQYFSVEGAATRLADFLTNELSSKKRRK